MSALPVLFAIRALGCKVSQYDAAALGTRLQALGFVPAGDRPPDVFIVHGCSVTARASQKVRQLLRSAGRRWPGVRLVLAGCEATRRDLHQEKTTETPWVLTRTPTDDELRALATGLTESKTLLPPQVPVRIERERTRAFIKVQDGCTQFCSYCIVPHVRGPERSVPPADVLTEAEALGAAGVKEIVLTGIHLGRYQPDLAELLRALDGVCGIQRIRLSSIEPNEVGEGIRDWLEQSPKACRFLHLPLQSGSDQILRAMKRPYSTADFARTVRELRERFPDIGISTDVIVGFPGETEALFAETEAFLRELDLFRLHIFRYSPRPGTPAADFPDQVDAAAKRARSDRLEQIWRAGAAPFQARFAGRPVEVLWETCSDGFWHGFSREYLPCRKPADGQDYTNRIEIIPATE